MSMFSDLYPTLRVLLGDTGAQVRYTTSQLDLGISIGLLEEESFTEGLDGGDKTIEPDVTEKSDKLRISLRAAIALLSPVSDAGSFRTKVLSVTRTSGRQGHLGYLISKLNSFTRGEFTVGSDTEWDMFLRGSDEAISKLAQFPG